MAGSLGVHRGEPDIFDGEEFVIPDNLAADTSHALKAMEDEAQRRKAEIAAPAPRAVPARSRALRPLARPPRVRCPSAAAFRSGAGCSLCQRTS